MYNLPITLIFIILSACQQPIASFEFFSGEVDRSFSPIHFNIDLEISHHGNYYLENVEGGKRYPVQAVSETEWVTILDHFPANTRITLELKEGDFNNTLFHTVNIIENEEGIEITKDGKPFLFYQSQTTGPEGNQPEYYKRSGFIHPLYSPGGAILTDGFPEGHTHQNGIFNAWTNTTFKNEKVDFWNRQEELGTISHMETLQVNEGRLIGQFSTRLSHISLEHGEVLEEEWQITIYPIKQYHLFDIRSEQVNTSQDTLFLNEYLYGGMAFRGSKEWNRDDDDHFTNTWEILTNEGSDNETANHTKASWVDASGMINGKKAGLTVLGFPDNFRAPQAVRVHPQMPYWVYSPVVEGPFYIAPGQKYVSRYRYLAHDGQLDKKELDVIYADLQHPVEVRTLSK